MSLRGQALYAGVRLQVAQTYDRIDLVDDGKKMIYTTLPADYTMKWAPAVAIMTIPKT